MNLNLGSHQLMLPGFLNLDIEPLTAPPGMAFRQWDLRWGLPSDCRPVTFVNASHVLEHFPWTEAVSLVRAVHRVLQSGGVFRVAVPDLRLLVDAYLADQMDRFTAVQPPIYQQVQSPGLKLSFLLLGNNSHDCTRDHYTGHQLLLDESGLRELLGAGGFASAAITRVAFDARYDAPNTENHSLVMEAVKTEGELA